MKNIPKLVPSSVPIYREDKLTMISKVST